MKKSVTRLVLLAFALILSMLISGCGSTGKTSKTGANAEENHPKPVVPEQPHIVAQDLTISDNQFASGERPEQRIGITAFVMKDEQDNYAIQFTRDTIPDAFHWGTSQHIDAIYVVTDDKKGTITQIREADASDISKKLTEVQLKPSYTNNDPDYSKLQEEPFSSADSFVPRKSSCPYKAIIECTCYPDKYIRAKILDTTTGDQNWFFVTKPEGGSNLDRVQFSGAAFDRNNNLWITHVYRDSNYRGTFYLEVYARDKTNQLWKRVDRIEDATGRYPRFHFVESSGTPSETDNLLYAGPPGAMIPYKEGVLIAQVLWFKKSEQSPEYWPQIFLTYYSLAS